ncbi:MAG: hypothetical protein ABI843_07625 [Dokdonella sp.]
MTLRPVCLAAGFAGLAFVACTLAAPLPSTASPATLHTDLRGMRARASGSPFEVPHAMAGSGTGAWTPLGPFGGDVDSVAASPTHADIVLAGIAPGGSFGGTLYRSSDGGSQWSAVGDLAGISVYDVAFAPDGTAYVATQDSVWISHDDGSNWSQQTLGIDPLNDAVSSLAIDPANAATIWAGISDAGGFQTVNLMRSLDGGSTWHDRTPPHAAAMTGTGIAIDPADSDTVIAVFRGDFGGGEVWVSRDGGDTWDNRTDGLPGTPVNAVSYDGTRLLVGGGENFGSQDFGLYTSDDLGVGWTPLHGSNWPLLVATAIAVDPNDTQTIAVATDGTGINLTHDGGASWDVGAGGSGALAAQSVRYAPASSQQLFVGASSLGVFESSDGGAAFAATSNGIAELSLYSIAASPLDPTQLAVAFQGNNNGGVFSSADGGATWAIEPVPPTRYSKVGFSPAGVLYAISSGPSTVAPEGLYRREGDGSWSGLGPDQGDLYESDLVALRFSNNDPSLILLGGADFGVAGNEGTVWRSTDAGKNWVKQYEGDAATFVSAIEIVEDGSDQTMAAAYTGTDTPDQGGVLRSVDGGADWAPIYQQSTYLQRPNLCASAANAQTFFLAAAIDFSSSGLWRSVDGGASWSPTGWSGPTIAGLACDPFDSHVLYIAQQSTVRAARSSDQGVSFTPFASGLAAAGYPTQLAIAHDDHTARLLMSTSKGSEATPIVNGDPIFADGFDG